MIWTSFVARTKKNSSVSEILAKPMWTRQFIENQGGNKAVARNSFPSLVLPQFKTSACFWRASFYSIATQKKANFNKKKSQVRDKNSCIVVGELLRL